MSRLVARALVAPVLGGGRARCGGADPRRGGREHRQRAMAHGRGRGAPPSWWISPGYNNTGTLHSVTAGVPGKVGTAYSFGGSKVQSYVEVPDSPSLNPGAAKINISVSFNTKTLPTSGDFDLVRKGDYPGGGVQGRAAAERGRSTVHVPRHLGPCIALPGWLGLLTNGAWHHDQLHRQTRHRGSKL